MQSGKKDLFFGKIFIPYSLYNEMISLGSFFKAIAPATIEPVLVPAIISK